ncbi:flagellar hook-associated protein FlgK [Roseburia sp. MSJ-14]|uniref:flagellar hook-associated protein FlgK n=1 Tax=Roseburia sp. MSJ-14 TaxID=2841514 RepID=UPI001C0FC4B1|nr:flagellar hook-associated protein FlgK [Roseburia sp. MSJ-14]MBU5474807.1 flagellar hook-associated protein FlgK [Roseburia sp. MSJ-14]
MPSTFFGLTISSSALTSFQAATNTVANNISNVNTKGYTRQEAIRVAADALRVNQKYGMAGSGVDTTEIKQIRDFYYDVRYWENNAKVGLYDSKLYYMQQIEDYLIDDDSAKGFSTILDEMFNALNTLNSNPNDLDKRQQFISKSQSFATFFNGLNTGLSKIQEDCNKEIATQVENINSIAQKIALLNKQINVIELQGTNANELRDQRALLVDELSELVPVEVTETQVKNSNYPNMYTGATDYVLKINGKTLVNNFEYKTLKCVARDEKVNQSDIEGLYDIYWADSNIPYNAASKASDGRLRALFEIRDGNNAEGFSGKVQNVTAGTGGDIVTLKNPSITDVNYMTMPEKGILTMNNTQYRYTGFTYDEATKTYQFQLDTTLSVEEKSKVMGKNAAIGENIDAMGIPYYQAQANAFLREFAKQFNEIQKKGVTLDGTPGDSFFVGEKPDGTEWNFGDYNSTVGSNMNTSGNYYYWLTGANVKVTQNVVKTPENMVTLTADELANGTDNPSLVNEMAQLYKNVKMFRGSGANEFLRCLISDNSVDTEKSQLFLKNYSNISETIVQKRMSISGVDEDEEALDMLKFQNAYNLASRMIQTMSEMYDRLILETGV